MLITANYVANPMDKQISRFYLRHAGTGAGLAICSLQGMLGPLKFVLQQQARCLPVDMSITSMGIRSPTSSLFFPPLRLNPVTI